jgi:choline-sulfatase
MRRLLMLGSLTLVFTSVAGAGPNCVGRVRPPLNLVVITLDTTRADRLSPYGNMDVSLPHLERLAADGVIFDQATSVGALTLPAHTSLFTGLLPTTHGVRDNADAPLAPSQVTLAEILAARGYRTGAFVGSVVLGSDRGLAQGFETYGDVAAISRGPERGQRRGDEVVDEAVRWLDAERRQPFLLWIHLYDPHLPYTPPAPYDASPDPYVGEIAFADAQIGVVLKTLKRLGLSGRTVVVVAGDHGESLGEHGEDDHGIFLYESVLRVPLIVRAPGLAPRRVGDVVRLIDIMPTALALLGVDALPAHGVDLGPLMRGERRDLEAYAESTYPERFGWSPLFALRERRFKYIEAPRAELYDLAVDPFETRNIVGERPELAAAMRGRLEALRGLDLPGSRAGAPIDPSLRERLASLGYVTAASGHHRGGAGPDPKDCIGTAPFRRASHVPGPRSTVHCQEE